VERATALEEERFMIGTAIDGIEISASYKLIALSRQIALKSLRFEEQSMKYQAPLSISQTKCRTQLIMREIAPPKRPLKETSIWLAHAFRFWHSSKISEF